MKKKIFIIFIAFTFALSAIGLVSADDKASKNKKLSSQLSASLPASDGVLAIDVKRLVSESLPQILSSNKPKLDGILGKIEEIKEKTGIDLTRFESVAVGLKAKQTSPGEFEFEPVILARGTYDSGGLVALAKIVSKGNYREETVGNRTFYIFSVKEIAEEHLPKAKDGFIDSMIGKIFGKIGGEFALTSFDDKTIAFGSVARVRETIEGKSRVNSQLMELIDRNQSSVVSFGTNLPKGSSKFLGLDNAEVDRNIDVIQQLYGTFDTSGENTSVAMTAKTATVGQSEDLETFLKGLKMFGALIGSQKGADKKIYGKMIDSLKISRVNKEVSFELQVAQTDLDVIVGEKKK